MTTRPRLRTWRRRRRRIRTPLRGQTARESSSRAAVPAVALSTPELQARLKPVLNKGANMTIAAEGFRSAEEFATVAHAARNTEVPFMVLKHRVLTEGKSLAKAIRESKPDVNANAEVRRARAEARSDLNDLARLSGTAVGTAASGPTAVLPTMARLKSGPTAVLVDGSTAEGQNPSAAHAPRAQRHPFQRHAPFRQATVCCLRGMSPISPRHCRSAFATC